MSVSFQVSRVTRSRSSLQRYEDERDDRWRRRPFEAMGTSAAEFIRTERNGFLAAVHAAYAHHYPLVLSPDAVWLAIAQGFAHHVNSNALRLRSKFFRQVGRVEISIRRDDFIKGSRENPWPEVFGAFSDGIAQHIGNQRNLVVCDFSTTGAMERAASEIVLLDAMQSYCSYCVMTLCGIPEITLEGTVDDWRSVRRRAQALEEYELSWWTKTLVPILDQFVEAAEGKIDKSFWQAFFKHDDASGGPYVGGWINVLFPYVRADGGFGVASRKLVRNTRMHTWRSPQEYYEETKMYLVPKGVSCVPFDWRIVDETHHMEFLGGFLGIAQNAETLAVRPAIGWAVRDAEESNANENV